MEKLYKYTSEFALLMEEIENSVDENGVIPIELSEKLDKLNSDRLVKLGNCVEYYRSLTDAQDIINNRIKELQELKKSFNNKIDWLKQYLTNNLNGQKVDGGTFKISFRNSETVDIDEALDLETVYKHSPDLVDEVTYYQVNKIKVKEYAKKGLPIPEGISVKQNSNIQIK